VTFKLTVTRSSRLHLVAKCGNKGMSGGEGAEGKGAVIVDGMQLRRAAAQLAMPPSATSWKDSAILRYMWQQQDRSLAFWMLTHLRLGKGCLWAGLDSSILQMVLDHPIHYSENLNEFDNEIAVDDEQEGQDDDESELDRVV
jgi:hypothetical protein